MKLYGLSRDEFSLNLQMYERSNYEFEELNLVKQGSKFVEST